MTRTATSLMFIGQAQAAMDLYSQAFEEFLVLEVLRHGEDGPGAPGTVMVADATLAGHALRFSDSPVGHDFTFTPSMSLFLWLDRRAQDRAIEVLGKDGKMLMPLGDYGFSPRFCWLQDRFGVSWQLDLAG